MTEQFAVPGAGAVIERVIGGLRHILIQERFKADAPSEAGLIETPAGKIRAFESVFETLRREVREETGLTLTHIAGEAASTVYDAPGYRVIDFIPFCCVQNTTGDYPVMCLYFRCEAEGELVHHTDETKNLRWIPQDVLHQRLKAEPERFYPMSVQALRAYFHTQV